MDDYLDIDHEGVPSDPEETQELDAPEPGDNAPQRRQLQLTDQEHTRLRGHITEQVEGSRANNAARIAKFRRYWRMWRGLAVTKGNREDGEAFQYPMLKWITFGQWARVMQGVLGDDAEIVAKATSPSDEKDAKKAGAYMSWRVFEYMEAQTALSVWLFRALLFGRGHAEITYRQEFYWQRDLATGEDTEVLDYDGPRIRPLWPSQVILPAQDNIGSDDQYEWRIIRDVITPQQLLDGERRGEFQGISDNFDKICAQAQQRSERDYYYDDEMLDVDEAEGVARDSVLGNRDSLDVWRWYGKWRLPKGKRDSKISNLKFRNQDQSDLVVTYLPGAQLIVGIEDARELYPRMKKRDPLMSIAPVKDGSYWAPGLGELVEDLQNESSINYGIFRKAGMLSVGPLILFKPSSGFDPDTFEYKPGMAIPTEDPAGVRVVEMKANLSYAEAMQQLLKAIAELVTGVSDQTLGRVSDRPNAPQTASGQAMLIQEGNTRVSLDIGMIREDLSKVIKYIWQLDAEYADEDVFFRVTEEDAGGLFDVKNGFGTMTSEEREHPFGFDLRMATSVFSKEARKQQMLQIYGLSMQNPLVQTNPRALWVLLNRIWEAFGERNFADIIPEPPEPETPKTPKQEWMLAMKGDEFDVNPMDDDKAHLLDHRRRLQDEMDKEEERRDPQLEAKMTEHIIAHNKQIRQKMIMQALAAQALQELHSQGILPNNTNLTPQPAPATPIMGGQPPQAVAPPQQSQQQAVQGDQ